MSWQDGRKYECVCGFSTHNEDVWVEHIRTHEGATLKGQLATFEQVKEARAK